jgi:type III pantothenate kinase
MILAIDAGNTRVKWGWHDGTRWCALYDTPLATLAGRSDNPLADGPRRPERIVVSNVAGPEAGGRLLEWTSAWTVETCWLRAERQRCGVTNLYDRPEQLGADRWAALIAARALQTGDCLVICAGTATTVDLLSAGGQFLGGTILPGITLMKAALHRNTGGLPLGEGSAREHPRNTLDAIHTGCLDAQAGAIERMRRRLPGDAACVVSGGAGRELLPALPFPARYVENLVLEGLLRVAAALPA